MPKIEIVMRGKPNDRREVSPELSDEDATSQLTLIGARLGRQSGSIKLPWGVFSAPDVVSARLVRDEGPTIA